MISPQKQYTNEMKEKFGYYAIWNPGVPLELGDIGTIDNNNFTKLANLKDRGIEFEIHPDTTKMTMEHNSFGSVSIKSKLAGEVAPKLSVLKDIDAGIIVEFGKENATLFKANNTTSPSIKDKIKLGEEVLQLYKDGKWNKNWAIITELVEAESATIIISKSKGAKIELKANANIGIGSLDIANADFKFSDEFSKGLETKFISEEGLTPLFKAMGMKLRPFSSPDFKPKGHLDFENLTPENAENVFKEQLGFGYVLGLDADNEEMEHK